MLNAEDFSCFLVAGGARGVYRQTVDPASGERSGWTEVLHGGLGDLKLNTE